MFPLLFKIGPVPIHTYGFMIAVGFLVCLAVIRRLGTRAGVNVEKALDAAFLMLLVGFAGARLLFVITRFEYFMTDPLAVFKVWEGGLVFFGGPLAGIPFGWWYFRRNKLPIWTFLDVLAPGLVIAHAFGRLGCIAAGCCYGKPTGSSWGFKFYSELVDKNLHGVPLHPVQLYEAIALILLFLGMLWVSKRKVFEGQVAVTYLLAYPVIRTLIELFRGDLIRGFVVDNLISTSQFISILIFLAGVIALVFRLRDGGATTAAVRPAKAVRK